MVEFTVHWKDCKEGDTIDVPSEESLIAVEQVGMSIRVVWLEEA